LSLLYALFTANLLPILVVAGIGFALQRLLQIDPKPLSRVAFYACLPALVFQLLINTQIPPGDILRMMGLAALLVGLMALLSTAAARGLRLGPGLAAGFVLSVTFMNAGNFGLSLTKFAYGETGLALASIFYVASSMLSTALGVYIATVGRTSPLRALLGLFRVPALYAIPLAVSVRAAALPLPFAVARPIELLAQAAVPIMLLLLGMQMSAAGPVKRPGLLALAVGMRLVLSPLIAWFLAPGLGLVGLASQVGILEAATPAAVTNAIIALEFDAEPTFVTSAVLFSTLLSPLTITPLLALLGS
jgi:hypothetical protein